MRATTLARALAPFAQTFCLPLQQTREAQTPMTRAAKFIIIAIVTCFLLSLSRAARAEVHVPALIGDNMVVQQGAPARVWGWAEAGEQVTVSMAGKSAKAKADAKGRWEARIGPFQAGGGSGGATLHLTDIVLGNPTPAGPHGWVQFISQNNFQTHNGDVVPFFVTAVICIPLERPYSA